MDPNVTLTLPMQTEHLIDRIHFYLVPPLVLLGTLGNLLSLAVFRCTKLRRLSTSYYLTALSLSDTAFLLSLFAVWLEMVGVNSYNQPFLCQFVTYTSSVCCFLSPWLVVTFTVERFVATCYPLKRAAVCTVSRAKVVVAVLTVIAAGSYSYIFVMAGQIQTCVNEGYLCGLKRDYIRPMKILNSLDTFVALVIPVALITGLNFQIGCAVWHFEQVRRRMTPLHHNGNCSEDSLNVTASSLAVNSTRNCNSNLVHRDTRAGVTHGGRYQIKITKMLLMISSVFVGLNAPSYVMRLWTFHTGDAAVDSGQKINITCGLSLTNDSIDVVTEIPSPGVTRDETDMSYVIGQWFQLIFYLNFAINFLLYCVCGENFRKALRHLLWKLTMTVSRRDGALAGGGVAASCVGGASNGSSRRRWSRRNTGTIVISTQMLMTETHPSPATITKCRSVTPVTSI